MCSIRAQFGQSAIYNALYCSRNLTEASNDISHFFPYTQGNYGIDAEHRLMDFDVSQLDSQLPLSNMLWLDPHERDVPKVDPSIDYLDMDEDLAIEPSLSLLKLTDEYIDGLPDATRQAVRDRVHQLKEVMQQPSCHS